MYNLLGIIILNVFVYDYLHARNRSLTITTKFVLSMFFAILAMCMACVVEILCQTYCPMDQTVDAPNLTIFAQLPQDITIGIGQLFNLLASFEFAYYVAPHSAKSLFMTMQNVVPIIASYMSVLFNNMLSKYNYTLDFSVSSQM